MKLLKSYGLLAFLGLLAMSCMNGLEAQVSLSAISMNQLQELESSQVKRGVSMQDLEKDFPIQRIEGRPALSMLAKVSTDFDASDLPEGVSFGSRIGNVVSLKVDLKHLDAIHTLQKVEYIEVAAKIHRNLERAVQDVRADSVHLGLGLSKSYTGKGVLIGVTDWGFDYGHPMFYDSSLTNNRIMAAWDQFKTSGPAPAGSNFGTEYLGTSNVLAAQSDTSGTYYGNATHGSHVAGIAGGGGGGIGLTGVAPEANFIFASILLDAGAFMEAIAWMQDFAETENKRLVINMSWGLYNLGPLDGSSLLSLALNQLTEEGVVVVTSGGNNGDDNFHIKQDFPGDTLSCGVSFFPNNVIDRQYGQSVSMFGGQSQSFSTSFDLYQVNTKLASSPWFHTATSASFIDSFIVVGNDTLYFKMDIDDEHPQSFAPHIRLRLKKPNAALSVVVHVAASSGRVHLYNLLDQSSGEGNAGSSFTSFFGGPSGDNEYGIGEPACAEKIIAVGAHSSDIRLPNQTWIPGSIASFSSHGPTIDERMKPDLTAPGMNVLSSISSFADDNYFFEDSVSFNGRTYGFTRFSGTSMSAPMTTGIVALMLEANPFLSPSQVKEILRSSTRTDVRTDTIPSGGSTIWGMGKANALEAVKTAAIWMSREIEDEPSEFLIYPNTVSDELMVQIPEGRLVEAYRIFDLQGRRMLTGSFESSIDVQKLSFGTYLLHLETEEGIEVLKFEKGSQ